METGMTGGNRFQVHDLIRLKLTESFRFIPGDCFDRPLPEWALASLEESPWLVVRRGNERGGIPVGVRGALRNQRFGCVLCEEGLNEKIDKVLTPEQILLELLRMDENKNSELQAGPWSGCTELLRGFLNLPFYGKEVRSIGIGGSAGFEIASGTKVTTPNSDLDLILSLDRTCSRNLCLEIYEYFRSFPVRTDIILATVKGWTSLDEYVHCNGKFLVKTQEGCCLAEELW